MNINIKYHRYPHSILLKDILSNLIIKLYNCNELVEDFDENPSGRYFLVNKMQFILSSSPLLDDI
jgi:hypothetical protein